MPVDVTSCQVGVMSPAAVMHEVTTALDWKYYSTTSPKFFNTNTQD